MNEAAEDSKAWVPNRGDRRAAEDWSRAGVVLVVLAALCLTLFLTACSRGAPTTTGTSAAAVAPRSAAPSSQTSTTTVPETTMSATRLDRTLAEQQQRLLQVHEAVPRYLVDRTEPLTLGYLLEQSELVFSGTVAALDPETVFLEPETMVKGTPRFGTPVAFRCHIGSSQQTDSFLSGILTEGDELLVFARCYEETPKDPGLARSYLSTDLFDSVFMRVGDRFVNIRDITWSTNLGVDSGSIGAITDQSGEFMLYPAPPLYDLPEGTTRGYIDEDGNWVVERQFKWEREFSEGLAAVEIDGKVGFIDATGRVVIEPRFAFAGSFSDGLAVAQEPDGWPGYVDKSGDWVIEPGFQWNGSRPEGPATGAVDSFSEGLAGAACFSTDGEQIGFGFIDKAGSWAIEPAAEWVFADPFSEGLARVHVPYKGLVGFIDKTGAVIVRPQFGWASDFSEGLAAVRKDVAKELHDWAYIDTTGATVLSFNHDECTEVQPFSQGLAGVGVYSQDGATAFGFIDKTGSWAIEPRFDYVQPFSDGLAAARSGGKWGYVDTTGAWVIEPQFKSAEPFSGDLAWVVLDGVRGYLDRTGDLVYSEAWQEHKGTGTPGPL